MNYHRWYARLSYIYAFRITVTTSINVIGAKISQEIYLWDKITYLYWNLTRSTIFIAHLRTKFGAYILTYLPSFFFTHVNGLELFLIFAHVNMLIFYILHVSFQTLCILKYHIITNERLCLILNILCKKFVPFIVFMWLPPGHTVLLDYSTAIICLIVSDNRSPR